MSATSTLNDLSEFVIGTSRIQLLHDAIKIGKGVGDGTSKLGLTLSNKSTVLANDKLLGKLIVGELDAEGVPVGSSVSGHGLVDRNVCGQEKMCVTPMEAHWPRQERGEERQPTM